MARYWSGTIGGIDLEDGVGSVAGFEVAGAAAFEYAVTGNSVPAATGLLHTQYAPFTHGKPLELSFLHIPQSLATSLLTALKATLPTGGSVECSFTDGFQTIEGMFKPNVPAWYERGNPDGDYINDFVLRLVYTGVAP